MERYRPSGNVPMNAPGVSIASCAHGPGNNRDGDKGERANPSPAFNVCSRHSTMKSPFIEGCTSHWK